MKLLINACNIILLTLCFKIKVQLRTFHLKQPIKHCLVLKLLRSVTICLKNAEKILSVKKQIHLFKKKGGGIKKNFSKSFSYMIYISFSTDSNILIFVKITVQRKKLM